MESDDRNMPAYFIVAVGALAFVLLYIWQSVEVTKLRLDSKRLLRTQEQLVKEHDRFMYDIETIRIEKGNSKEAERRNMRRMVPSDYERIEVK
jgi:hypothetical protein